MTIQTRDRIAGLLTCFAGGFVAFGFFALTGQLDALDGAIEAEAQRVTACSQVPEMANACRIVISERK